MRTLALALVLLAVGCEWDPKYDSQAKLYVRWVNGAEPEADWRSLRTKITNRDFAQFTLSGDPKLAAAISKSEIRVHSNSSVSFLVEISVSATTPSASLEGVRALVDVVTTAVSSADRKMFAVATIEQPALQKR
jgi:hypothetical protein